MLLTRRALLACASILAVTVVAQAEPPHVSYIYPAGIQRGTSIDIKVGGHFLHDVATFLIDGRGVEAGRQIRPTHTQWFEGPVIPQPESQKIEDYPVDYLGTLKAQADAPLGTRDWSVHVSQGVTLPMKLVVGRLPEVIEEEIDGQPIPQLVKLPVTINGRTFPREDVDLWAFDVQQGQTVTCLAITGGIGSPVEAQLEVRDPNGVRLAATTGSAGTDPQVRFTAPTTGRYVIKINDANFGGLQQHIYRLSVSVGSYVDSVFPLGGRRGESIKLEVTGVGLEQKAVDVKLAADATDRIVWHPESAGSSDLGFALETGTLPESIEATANNTTETATTATVPGVLNGRIESVGDVDLWKFEAKKGQSLVLEMHASELGSALDSVVAILDSTGKQIAEADDNGQDVDSRLAFNVPTDGIYFAQVTDRVASRGGAQFGYRLHVLDAKTLDSAPFALEIQSQQRVVNVDRGGELKLKINVRRSSFNEAIDLAIEGLPAGVTVSDAVVAAKQNNATVTLKAEPNAVLNASKIQVIGKAKIGDAEQRAVATVRTNPPTKEPLDSLSLAVTVKTPFKFSGDFESKFAPRGSVYFRHYSLNRGGFEGPIEISLADRQARHLQGVTGPKIIVPPGVTEFDYPASLPPWLEVGRTSRTCLMAVGEIVDADGTKHKVCFTSKEQNDQIIVLTAPEEFSAAPEVTSIRAIPGESVAVPLQVGRASTLTQPATIEVVPAKHVRGVTAERVTVAPDVMKTFLTIKFDKDAIGPFNLPLTIRATTLDSRGQPVVHECVIEVVTDAPAPETIQVRPTAK